MNQKFCNIWVHASLLHVCHMTKAIQWKIPAMVGSIVVVGTLTCDLLHYVCDSKATQMKVQHYLIQELYKFELGHNTTELMKNICCLERWRHSWSQYNNQMVQEISFWLQELQQSGNMR